MIRHSIPQEHHFFSVLHFSLISKTFCYMLLKREILVILKLNVYEKIKILTEKNCKCPVMTSQIVFFTGKLFIFMFSWPTRTFNNSRNHNFINVQMQSCIFQLIFIIFLSMWKVFFFLCFFVYKKRQSRKHEFKSKPEEKVHNNPKKTGSGPP